MGRIAGTHKKSDISFNISEVNIDKFDDVLKQHTADQQPGFGYGDSVLSQLYKAYSKCNRLDNDRFKANFNKLYLQMNGMDLREMNQILDPIYAFCRNHVLAGFVERVKIELQLLQELK